jgi:isoquinoline 1-oxidoreductase beta subunit
VVARDSWSALRGLDALLLAWEPPAVLSAIRTGTEADPVVPDIHFEPDRSFEPDMAELPAETPSATARVAGGRATIWACLRDPGRARSEIAALTGLPDVAVRPVRLGGPEGRFVSPDYAVEAVRLSQALRRRPVTVLWTRSDDFPFRHGRQAGI